LSLIKLMSFPTVFLMISREMIFSSYELTSNLPNIKVSRYQGCGKATGPPLSR
jgi:hypothetical protein